MDAGRMRSFYQVRGRLATHITKLYTNVSEQTQALHLRYPGHRSPASSLTRRMPMKAQLSTKILMLTACTAAFAQPPQPPQPPPVRVQPGTPNPGGPETPPPTVNVPPDTVVLTVGNVKLTRAQFEQWVATLPDNLKGALTGPQKRKVIEQYAELTSLAQEARKRKLDQKPVVAIQIDQALAQALVQDVSANMKLDDAAMKAYYDQNKSEFETAKARHILIGVKPPGTPATPDKKELTDEQALAKAKQISEKI